MTCISNIRRLIVARMATMIIPSGGSVGDVLGALSTKEALPSYVKDAAKWASDTINAIKSDPKNKFGNDDEVIAGEILKRMGKHER